MKFAPSTEQFTDESFMAYLGVLTTSDALAEWDSMMSKIEGSLPNGGSAQGNSSNEDTAGDRPTEDELPEDDSIRLQPSILGAVAMQYIGRFTEIIDEVTGDTMLTAQGITAGHSITSRRGTCYGTIAKVAARSRDVGYPHITLSRTPLGVSDEQVLHQMAEVESFTLPLVLVGREDYPSPAVMQGALSTLMDSDWRSPDLRNVWPPMQLPTE